MFFSKGLKLLKFCTGVTKELHTGESIANEVHNVQAGTRCIWMYSSAALCGGGDDTSRSAPSVVMMVSRAGLEPLSPPSNR